MEEYLRLLKKKEDILNDIYLTEEAIKDKNTNYIDKREYKNDLTLYSWRLAEVEAEIREYENSNKGNKTK